MTKEDRAKARALCEAATPNWKVRELSMPGEALLQMGYDDRRSGLPFRSIQLRREDAAFASAARTLLPAALDEIDRLERGLKAIAKHVGAIGRSGNCELCNLVELWNMADLLLAGRLHDGTAPKGGTNG